MGVDGMAGWSPPYDVGQAAATRALAAAIAVAEADPSRILHELARPWRMRLAQGGRRAAAAGCVVYPAHRACAVWPRAGRQMNTALRIF